MEVPVGRGTEPPVPTIVATAHSWPETAGRQLPSEGIRSSMATRPFSRCPGQVARPEQCAILPSYSHFPEDAEGVAAYWFQQICREWGRASSPCPTPVGRSARFGAVRSVAEQQHRPAARRRARSQGTTTAGAYSCGGCGWTAVRSAGMGPAGSGWAPARRPSGR
jgi:hypothetical protein